MKLNDERIEDFNSRMNEWISKQGLFFQLTHGGTGLGGAPPLLGACLRLLFSFLLLLLLGAVSYGGFLFWKASGTALPKELNQGIANRLASSEVTSAKFERDFNSGRFKELLVKGNEETFFNHFSARNVRFSMSPLDGLGLLNKWEAGSIKIDKLQSSIKAGEADLERAKKSWESLFQDHSGFSLQSIEIRDASISWGYGSSATWGSIINSSMLADPTPKGWELTFKGGHFSQGIFRNLEIVRIKVLLDSEKGTSIPNAQLKYGDSTFDWNAEMVSGGSSPTFQGQGKLTKFPLKALLPRGLLPAVNGTISADIEIKGSINDSDGICYSIQAKPDGADGIFVTRQFPLLQLLNHLTPKLSYRKVPFTEGSFSLKTIGDSLKFENINLTSPSSESEPPLAVLTGSFQGRPAQGEDLKRESTLFDSVAESTSQTIGVGNPTDPSAENDFAEEIKRVFKKLQYLEPHQEVRYFEKNSTTKEADDEIEGQITKSYLTLSPRREWRAPFVVEGEIEMSVPAFILNDTINLPGTSGLEADSDLGTIKIPLSGLVLRSTDELNHEWEKALTEAERSR